MILAIDGPAGSGKSSSARAVAERLGYRHLDSGAFYRALTYLALRAGIPVERWPALTSEQLDRFGVRAEAAGRGYRLLAGGRDITGDLRSVEVNRHVSEMARVPAVRDWLLERLRDAARLGSLVADGRDIGTVVFPNAELKVFLVADPAVRARRRLLEQGAERPDPAAVAAEVARLRERDRIDSEREVAPLLQAEDAVVLDTSRLDFDEQVERIVSLAAERAGQGERG